VAEREAGRGDGGQGACSTRRRSEADGGEIGAGRSAADRWGHGGWRTRSGFFRLWPQFETAHPESQESLPTGKVEIEGQSAEVGRGLGGEEEVGVVKEGLSAGKVSGRSGRRPGA